MVSVLEWNEGEMFAWNIIWTPVKGEAYLCGNADTLDEKAINDTSFFILFHPDVWNVAFNGKTSQSVLKWARGIKTHLYGGFFVFHGNEILDGTDVCWSTSFKDQSIGLQYERVVF